jgi:hypothetical protein
LNLQAFPANNEPCVSDGHQDSRSGGPNPPPRLSHTEGYEAARGVLVRCELLQSSHEACTVFLASCSALKYHCC